MVVYSMCTRVDFILHALYWKNMLLNNEKLLNSWIFKSEIIFYCSSYHVQIYNGYLNENQILL